jgi:phospholipid transport system substrate-binding protein
MFPLSAANSASLRRIDFIFIQEKVQRDLGEAATKVVPTRGGTTSVDYRLHQVHDQWKIYDIVVEDISLVGDYRSQFNRILSNDIFDCEQLN